MSALPRPAPTGRRARVANHDAREHLLDAATTLFSERGVANTTVAQIATASGVTSAMVHYWFQNRERLLDAVVEERIARAFLAVWSPFDPADETPLAQIQGIVQRMFEVTEKLPWLPSLWLREIVNEGGLLRERAFRHIPFKKVQGFGQSIARFKARGQLNADIEPLLLFGSILALVMLPQATSKIWQQFNPPATFDRAGLERHVTGLLANGLCGGLVPPAPAEHIQPNHGQPLAAHRARRKTP